MTIPKPVIRVTALFVLMALATLLATACNTVKGVGEDVSAAGQTIADVADHKN